MNARLFCLQPETAVIEGLSTDIALAQHASRHQEVGAATGRGGQIVSFDIVQPLDTSSPILLMAAGAENETAEPEIWIWKAKN